ncbi:MULTISPECIES: AMP-binding protein [Sorangium]|uniref:AMP-dependent synthetase n=1 Tax=Sorangium cellulosum TaxID=56 RepID=A0A4P2QGX4_SORCE|nr:MULTISPECIES: AMP-binding protein [Sorangium]AUX29119.1 AMP-dependent synthetase [Sorangium cellulosum]WCQ88510.1 hypothetical protein NQZ70_01188 [Sorangium sp. Soce836]
MDVPAALRSLDLSREDDVPDLAWLTASHDDPPAFWSALAEHARRIAPAPRSRPGQAYDLYHDTVGRHAATTRVALVVHDRRAGWRSLSYAELAARASACAQAWALAGVAPGAAVALVLPLGVDWLVAFAAALRLGLVVSFLAPAGEHALLRRLKALDPAHVVVDPAAPPLGPFAERALRLVEGGPPHAAPPHAYAPDEPCARLFSPLRAPLAEPVDLAAEIAWQNAYRDAVFAYRLGAGAGDALALPGFPPQQHQPAALMATMLAGASFVHLPLADIEANPALLHEQPITTLGVAPALCELLRKTPLGPPPKLRHWLKSVDEPLDWVAWNDFVRRNDLGKIPTSNLLVDAASGGAVLFSARRPGSLQALALPAPGRPFALFDAAGSGEPAAGGVGVFVPMPGGDPEKDGWFLLARRGSEYLWGSTLAPRRAGRVFPASEVVERASAIPGVAGACVLPIATGDPGARWAFALLVFTGAARSLAAAPAPPAAAVEAALREDLGPDFVPDRISVFPLFPRRKGGKVDAEWCRRQYSSGLLVRKASHPVFRRLAELRGSLLGA